MSPGTNGNERTMYSKDAYVKMTKSYEVTRRKTQCFMNLMVILIEILKRNGHKAFLTALKRWLDIEIIELQGLHNDSGRRTAQHMLYSVWDTRYFLSTGCRPLSARTPMPLSPRTPPRAEGGDSRDTTLFGTERAVTRPENCNSIYSPSVPGSCAFYDKSNQQLFMLDFGARHSLVRLRQSGTARAVNKRVRGVCAMISQKRVFRNLVGRF